MNVPRSSAVLALVLSSFAVSTAACEANDPIPSPETRRLEIAADTGTIAFEVEIADTDASRQRGLMGRTELAEGEGMVFLFDGPTTASFWMKDTLIPLSISFWDAERKVVAVLDMEPCESEPCQLYGPDRPYVGAVEVALGGLEGVRVGDMVYLEDP